jgi:hypothetical protein
MDSTPGRIALDTGRLWWLDPDNRSGGCQARCRSRRWAPPADSSRPGSGPDDSPPGPRREGEGRDPRGAWGSPPTRARWRALPGRVMRRCRGGRRESANRRSVRRRSVWRSPRDLVHWPVESRPRRGASREGPRFGPVEQDRDCRRCHRRCILQRPHTTSSQSSHNVIATCNCLLVVEIDGTRPKSERRAQRPTPGNRSARRRLCVRQ